VIGPEIRVVPEFQILQVLKCVSASAKPQAKIRKMLQALKLLDQRVDFHKLLEGPARSGKPTVKAIVVREIVQNLVVVVLEKLVDDPGM
jgi:hypothetical protein